MEKETLLALQQIETIATAECRACGDKPCTHSTFFQDIAEIAKKAQHPAERGEGERG